MKISAQWRTFTAAPHRVMFLGGAIQTLAAMLLWLIEMATRHGAVGHPLDWPIMPNALHSYLMIFGLFPFFMFGFLMTTFPRWMSHKEITAKSYVPAFVLLLLGNAGFYAGLLAGRSVLIVAVLLMLAGWGFALQALLRVLLDSQHKDKKHPQIIFIAFSLGWCSMAAYLIWLWSDSTVWLDLATQGGLWLFLLPVFATVGHKMIPFFTSAAQTQQPIARPTWSWRVILAASATHGVLQFAGASAWLWVCDMPLAMAALYLTWLWRLHHSFSNPMLAVLHVGFAWIGIAMLLFAVQSFALFASHDATPIWGMAPLHALTIGCYATLLIGFGTRVTLGHSGLPMKADTPLQLMFAGMQCVAVVRVLADILPVQFRNGLYLAAAAIWLACFVPWVFRYLPVYIKPRVDGRAG